MNKKRKILTVVALVAFGAIILSHYFNYDWRWWWSDVRTANAHAIAIQRDEGNTVTVLNVSDSRANGETWYTVEVESRPRHGFHIGPVYPKWNANQSMLPDVRMPLFVLGVFYAGLFAILGDNKRKEQ